METDRGRERETDRGRERETEGSEERSVIILSRLNYFVDIEKVSSV